MPAPDMRTQLGITLRLIAALTLLVGLIFGGWIAGPQDLRWAWAGLVAFTACTLLAHVIASIPRAGSRHRR